MTTRVAEGLEGARQEMLVHLFCASFVANAHACAPLIISGEKERLLAVFESMEEKKSEYERDKQWQQDRKLSLNNFYFLFLLLVMLSIFFVS